MALLGKNDLTLISQYTCIVSLLLPASLSPPRNLTINEDIAKTEKTGHRNHLPND